MSNLHIKTIIFLLVMAFIINLPFGILRSRVRRFSFKWFLYIHMPIPIIVLARYFANLDFSYAPLVILASISGQYIGGNIDI